MMGREQFLGWIERGLTQLCGKVEIMNKAVRVLVLLAALTVGLAGCGPADAVTAGTGTLELTLSLPEGYHLNEETDSWVTWEVDGTVVHAEGETDTYLTDLAEPVRLPVTFAAGEAEAIAHLNIRYCSDTDGMCLVEMQAVTLPVKVAANGNRSTVAAAFDIVPPEL